MIPSFQQLRNLDPQHYLALCIYQPNTSQAGGKKCKFACFGDEKAKDFGEEL